MKRGAPGHVEEQDNNVCKNETMQLLFIFFFIPEAYGSVKHRKIENIMGLAYVYNFNSQTGHLIL